MALKYSVALRNARGDAKIAAVGNAGKLRILSGAAPANVAAAETGTLLAEFTLGSPFAPATSGGLVSPTLPAAVFPGNAGTAGYWRVRTAGGTAVMHGSIGLGGSGADIIASRLDLVVEDQLSVLSWTLDEGGA